MPRRSRPSPDPAAGKNRTACTRLPLAPDVSVEEADRLAKKLTTAELVARINEAKACRMRQTRGRLMAAGYGSDPFSAPVSDQYIYERVVFVMAKGPSMAALKFLPKAAKADLAAIRKGDFATCWLTVLVTQTRKPTWQHHARKLAQYRKATQKFSDALAIARAAALPEADHPPEVTTAPEGVPANWPLPRSPRDPDWKPIAMEFRRKKKKSRE